MAPLTIQELDDLQFSMMARMDEELLPALTRANRMDELETLLAILGMSDLLKDNSESKQPEIGKIVVLGDTRVPIPKLKCVIKKAGYDVGLFEFHTDYKRLQHFDFGKLRGSMGYIAIFAGPMPHSTPGAERACSFIDRVEQNLIDYPALFRLGKPGELKITKNSFEEGLKRFEHFLETGSM